MNNTKYWHTDRGFVNPDGCFTKRGLRFSTIRWIISRIFAKPYKVEIDMPPSHIVPRNEALALLEKYKDTPTVTWLGHATFLFKINGISILTDPLLFGNPGPSWMRGLTRLPCPLDVKDFNVDILLVSHEHPDHIHHPTLKGLTEKSNIQPILPLGVGKKIQKHGFKEAVELDWFCSTEINNTIKITAVPAIHYSNFSNSTLWAGFIISFNDSSGIEKKNYFAGDTDYGSFMKRDIAPYGPFNIACIGVGGFYLPFRSVAELVHTNPEEAIQTAKDINTKNVIGMHWGTIKMADENPNELFPRMQKQAKEIGYVGEIKMLRIGETITI